MGGVNFNSLPTELRMHIWEDVLSTHCQKRRRIEITFKDGEIYPLSRPPALLHVNRESRYITVRKYKPWLAQFAGTTAQQAWEASACLEVRNAIVFVRNNRSKLSRLDNVYINFERDTLAIMKLQWSNWEFAPLDLLLLRSLDVNLSDWLHWGYTIALICQFAKLRKLKLLTRENDYHAALKKDHVKETLRRRSELVTTHILCEGVIRRNRKAEMLMVWTSYKYIVRSTGEDYQTVLGRRPLPHMSCPASDPNQVNVAQPATPGSDIQLITGDDYFLRKAGLKRRAPQDFEMSQYRKLRRYENGSTRRRYSPQEFEHLQIFDLTQEESPHVPAGSCFSAYPTPPSSQQSATSLIESSSSRPTETSLSYFPESDCCIRRPGTPSSLPVSLPVFKSPLSYPGNGTPQNASPATPKNRHTDFVPLSSNGETIALPSFQSPLAYLAEVGFSLDDLKLDLSELENSPDQRDMDSSDLHIRANEHLSAKLSEIREGPMLMDDDNYDIIISQHASSTNDQTRLLAPTSTHPLSPPASLIRNTSSTSSPPSSALSSPQPPFHQPSPEPLSDFYVPLLIHAQRLTPTGHELLIEWEDYPLPQDYTWEPLDSFTSSMPLFVHEWQQRIPSPISRLADTTQDHQQVGNQRGQVTVYEIEEIVGTKVVKGERWYLVKWLGFSKLAERTWEPEKVLRVDVPWLVSEFEEARQKMRKKDKKTKTKKKKKKKGKSASDAQSVVKNTVGRKVSKERRCRS